MSPHTQLSAGTWQHTRVHTPQGRFLIRASHAGVFLTATDVLVSVQNGPLLLGHTSKVWVAAAEGSPEVAEEDRLAHAMGTLALIIVGNRPETLLQHQLAFPGSFVLLLHEDHGGVRDQLAGTRICCDSYTTVTAKAANAVRR